MDGEAIIVRPVKNYREPADSKEGRAIEKYVCTICGYIYDPASGDPENGVAAGTPFGNVPDDWVCPVCGAGKDVFEPEK